MSEISVEKLRSSAFEMSCADQHRLATFVAENVGYVLVSEMDNLQTAEVVAQYRLDAARDERVNAQLRKALAEAREALEADGLSRPERVQLALQAIEIGLHGVVGQQDR
jgi:hypothetical protein